MLFLKPSIIQRRCLYPFRYCTVLLVIFSSCTLVKPKNYKPWPHKNVEGSFWVRLSDESIIQSKNSENWFSLENLNKLFEKNQVYSFEKALPYAKNKELLKTYEIKCKCNSELLIEQMDKLFHDYFYSFSNDEKGLNNTLYNPSDHMWQLTLSNPNDWLWSLRVTECDKAWEYTKGCSDIIVAVMDFDIDISHPDLSSEVLKPYDPYTGVPFTNNPWHGHGTTVSSIAAAETSPYGQNALGQMASAGFNNKMIFYNSNVSRHTFLQKAQHASFVEGAKIIVSCAGSSLYCNADLSSGEDLILKDILDNGTIIIMPAGNGLSGFHCGTHTSYQPFYPFSPIYDNRVIIVSSSSKTDSHYSFDNGSAKTHSHFPQVDICAPGYDVMGASSTNSGTNSWPYFGSYGGTSFSSPLVASISSLILSINPSLTPQQVENIIKTTSDPITDATSYPGEVGAGRINAYKAVKSVLDIGTKFIQNRTYIPGGGSLGSNSYIESGITKVISGSNVTSSIPSGIVEIKPNTNVTFESPFGITLKPGFEVSNNAIFNINITTKPCK